MKVKRILVFPCGSEVGLEIYRSLRYSQHVVLFGGSSVEDHGKFVYPRYIADIPFINNPGFEMVIRNVIEKYQIDAIYPTMDSVIVALKRIEHKIGCKVISSNIETTEICLSKELTYNWFDKVVKIPKLYWDINFVENFPVYIKPKIGYGSRGAKKVMSIEEAIAHMSEWPNSIISEYLPGEEFTVDCFTNNKGELLFAKARQRKRIKMGISVNTKYVEEEQEFYNIAEKINQKLSFQGAWFFQIKKDSNNVLTLMEVAARLGGSSGLSRAIGVNLALMSVFDAFNIEVSTLINSYSVELDRALDNVFKIDIEYEKVYVDFDDCLVLNGELNIELVTFLYQAIREGKSVTLISKHDGKLNDALKKLRIYHVFDEIIHLKKDQAKCSYIDNVSAIFIDDSFKERLEARKVGLYVFAPDMVECLLK